MSTFIQIKAIPPSERPEGIHPWMENLYISDRDSNRGDFFYTLEDLKITSHVIVTADHSRQLGSHYIQSYYDGYDGLLYIAWMVPEVWRGEYEAPKYDDLVYPYKG